MEECSNDDEMYLKADQLLAHMIAKHSTTKWICNPCSTNAKQASESDQSDPQVLLFFDSAESWQAHTQKEHGNLGPAPQRDILTELSTRQVIGPMECPLCKTEPTEPSTGIDEHILKHLHEFALRALPEHAGPANEEESTAFRVSSSASILSYTRDDWTNDVAARNDEFIDPEIMTTMFNFLESRLERFDPEFSEQARTRLSTCRSILERKYQFNPIDEVQMDHIPIINLMAARRICIYNDEILPNGERPRITLEMEQDILNTALERVSDMNDSGRLAIKNSLRLLKGKLMVHLSAID